MMRHLTAVSLRGTSVATLASKDRVARFPRVALVTWQSVSFYLAAGSTDCHVVALPFAYTLNRPRSDDRGRFAFRVAFSLF